jgi:SAM-dependent methyltransferase
MAQGSLLGNAITVGVTGTGMLSREVSSIDSRLLEQRVRQELTAVSPHPAPAIEPAAPPAVEPAAPSVVEEVGTPPPPASATLPDAIARSPPAMNRGWLGRIVKVVGEFFGRTHRLQLEVSAIWAWAEDMAGQVHELTKQVPELTRQVHELTKEVERLEGVRQRELEGLRQRELEPLRREVGDLSSAGKEAARAVSRLQGDLHFEHRRLARLVGDASSSGSTPIVASPTMETSSRFTLGFEEHFRGAREDIRQRLRFYLDRVKNQPTFNPSLPLLDIGCGRGEWLELMREAGITAYGVDTNHLVVDECVKLGLEVRHADAIVHLTNLPDNALGGISIFHLIEHLPLDVLLQLIDEARRTLVPGGLLLLETPNPENLKVGACTFHHDPTHLRPIPPLLAKYLVESRGFGDVELMLINPYPASFLIQEDSEAARRLNDVLYGPQDVAVIARKA